MPTTSRVVRHPLSSMLSRFTGPVEVTAATRDLALDKMRSELRYRLELCPCTGEQYKDLEIEIIETRQADASAGANG